jgi:hypothetical protein
MLTAVEHLPGWRRQADAAHIEIPHPRAALSEYSPNPRQIVETALDRILWKPVDFDYNDALRLGVEHRQVKQRKREEK